MGVPNPRGGGPGGSQPITVVARQAMALTCDVATVTQRHFRSGGHQQDYRQGGQRLQEQDPGADDSEQDALRCGAKLIPAAIFWSMAGSCAAFSG